MGPPWGDGSSPQCVFSTPLPGCSELSVAWSRLSLPESTLINKRGLATVLNACLPMSQKVTTLVAPSSFHSATSLTVRQHGLIYTI